MTSQKHSPEPGKTALVTGASRGIGAAIARRLAADGLAVAVNYAGNADAARNVVEDITAQNGNARAFQADVSDAGAVEQMFAAVRDWSGEPDILVTSAGIMELSPLASCSDDSFARMMQINVAGTFHCLRLAAKAMGEGGRIITVSTTALALNLPTYGAYCASKAAVEAMTPILAKELAGRNITVNTVSPGPTATELFLDGKSQEQIDRLTGMIPMGRLGQPEDIASVVSMLAGPDGGWINGQVLRANGGIG